MGKNVRGSYVDGAYVIPQENIEIIRIVSPKRPTSNEQKDPKNK